MDINIIDDKFIEMNESISLYLSSGIGVSLSPFAKAEVIIISDDGMDILFKSNVCLEWAAIENIGLGLNILQNIAIG